MKVIRTSLTAGAMLVFASTANAETIDNYPDFDTCREQASSITLGELAAQKGDTGAARVTKFLQCRIGFENANRYFGTALELPDEILLEVRKMCVHSGPKLAFGTPLAEVLCAARYQKTHYDPDALEI